MVSLSYKDIQFIILALIEYKENKLTPMSWHTDEDLISELGNDYLFVESLISKLKDYINEQIKES